MWKALAFGGRMNEQENSAEHAVTDDKNDTSRKNRKSQLPFHCGRKEADEISSEAVTNAMGIVYLVQPRTISGLNSALIAGAPCADNLRNNDWIISGLQTAEGEKWPGKPSGLSSARRRGE
jgi:hypothetical protein